MKHMWQNQEPYGISGHCWAQAEPLLYHDSGCSTICLAVIGSPALELLIAFAVCVRVLGLSWMGAKHPALVIICKA